ncbi:MAG: hypothetical protein JXR69_08230 [Candidatus Delongbacteria bacterium]|nr:hypothetical protein [Candidatus Delongbacteria bacterium]
MIKYFLIFFLLTFSAGSLLYSEDQKISKKNNKTEYLVLPFGYYNPTTNFGFGLYSIFLFKENSNSERSRLRTEISYTLNDQIIFRYKSFFYLQNSRLLMKANVKKFISNYYGLSNNSDNDKESYSYFSTDFILDFNRDLHKHFSYSLLYDLDLFHITKYDEGGMLEYDGFNYDKIKFNNCLGFGFNYENVSNKFFRNGISADIQYLTSSRIIGSDNNFSVFNTDVKYFLAYKQSSINLQSASRFTFGNVPFTKLSSLGGTDNLRGYPDKRFTDMNMILFQSEFDFRIYKKVSGSLFYSFGDVFDPFSDLRFNKLKQGYGIGLLYDLLGTAIRVDVATSPENDIQIIATGNRAF